MIGAAALLLPATHAENALRRLPVDRREQDNRLFLSPKGKGGYTFSQALELQREASIGALDRHYLDNGAVVASVDDEDYQWVWQRDRAHVSLRRLLEGDPEDPKHRSLIQKHIQFDEHFRHNGRHHPRGGLSAGRFAKDGWIWNEIWASPQHDGPPLLMASMSAEGLAMKDRDPALAGRLLAAVIEYGEHAIRNTDREHYCLWEEVVAKRHFWTVMSEVTGYFAAGLFCEAMNEREQAKRFLNWHRIRSNDAQVFLEDRKYRIIFPHWKVKKEGSIVTKTFPPVDSHVMSALLLVHESALRFNHPDFETPISITEPFALRTMAEISNFSACFAVNKGVKSSEGILIARYPWDKYGGPKDAKERKEGGNPWPLLTFDFGNYMFRLATVYLNQGEVDATGYNHEALSQLTDIHDLPKEIIPADHPAFPKIIIALSQRGDAQIAAVLKRTMFYNTDPNFDLKHHHHFRLSEQLHRDSGNPYSVLDLAWSHVAFLGAYEARQAFEEALENNLLLSNA